MRRRVLKRSSQAGYRFMASDKEERSPEDSAGGGQLHRFLDRLPWEKTLIWGLILLAVYQLRSFFFLIFMTFLISYCLRSIAMWLQRLISPTRERLWLERLLTIGCFVFLLFGLVELGFYLGPRLRDQGEKLIDRVSRMDPGKQLTEVLSDTLGPVLFRLKYGDDDDERYKEAFAEFRKTGLRVVEFQEFDDLRDSLQEKFNLQVEREAARQIEDDISGARQPKPDYESWFSTVKAPEIFESDQDRWLSAARASHQAKRLLNKELPEFDKVSEEGVEAAVNEEIVRSWLADDDRALGTQSEWKTYLIETRTKELLATAENEAKFKEYFETERSENPDRIPYDYPHYIELRKAFDDGKEAFSNYLQSVDHLTEVVDEEELLRKQQEDFRSSEQYALTQEWQDGQGPLASTIKQAIAEYTPDVDWARSFFTEAFKVPMALAWSLLLSLFITLDFTRIRNGVQRLKDSRLRKFYLEIAPSLTSFGRLIGRAFLAQGAIAICNTLLTYAAIKLLGIQNEVFLCAIVFVCSFIPVLGVVLSSVPIAVVAVVQPDGSLILAVKAIIAILVIHFIETSLLNPKIIGDMLHLHPVMVLAVLFVGQHFFGVWGLLLGVPVAVYIIRFVILDEGIPGLIPREPSKGTHSRSPPPSRAQEVTDSKVAEPTHEPAARSGQVLALMGRESSGEGSSDAP